MVALMLQIWLHLPFLLGINDEYVTEEMASLVSLKDTIKSKDLYEAVKNMLKWFSLAIVNTSSMVTDGAPAVVGKREPFVKVIEDGAIAAQTHVWWRIIT